MAQESMFPDVNRWRAKERMKAAAEMQRRREMAAGMLAKIERMNQETDRRYSADEQAVAEMMDNAIQRRNRQAQEEWASKHLARREPIQVNPTDEEMNETAERLGYKPLLDVYPEPKGF